MPDGEMRRPPQLWEQRLARTTAILGAGISSSGDNTAIVPPTPPPGSGGGTEPAPVLPPPGDFIAPSTPTLIGSVQGINVVWNGLNSAGDLWPSDTSYVEVHMDTSGPTFTVGTATLKGRLARPGGLAVTGLSAGTTYYFRLRGADPAGNFTAAGTAASGQPGLINAPDIAANAITANSIVAGTITGWSINSAFLSGGTVSGGFITGGTVSAGFITGGTITGATITSTSVAGYLTPTDVGSGGSTTIDGGRITTGTVAAARIDVANLTAEKLTSGPFSSRRVVIGEVGSTDAVQFKGASTSNGWILSHNSGNNGLSLTSTYSGVDFTIVPNVDIQTSAGIASSTNGRGLRVASNGEVFSYGIDDNTTANAANVRVGASAQLLRSTSTQQVKNHIISLGGDLVGVDSAKVSSESASANPYDVLEIAPVEFQSLAPTDGGQRLLGFIAENVAQVFPWAAEWDETGEPSSVADRPVLAALLAVVKDQQTTITDLRARIEALEA